MESTKESTDAFHNSVDYCFTPGYHDQGGRTLDPQGRIPLLPRYVHTLIRRALLALHAQPGSEKSEIMDWLQLLGVDKFADMCGQREEFPEPLFSQGFRV